MFKLDMDALRRVANGGYAAKAANLAKTDTEPPQEIAVLATLASSQQTVPAANDSTPTPDRMCWPTDRRIDAPMTEAEIATFTVRVLDYMRKGPHFA